MKLQAQKDLTKVPNKAHFYGIRLNQAETCYLADFIIDSNGETQAMLLGKPIRHKELNLIRTALGMPAERKEEINIPTKEELTQEQYAEWLNPVTLYLRVNPKDTRYLNITKIEPWKGDNAVSPEGELKF